MMEPVRFTAQQNIDYQSQQRGITVEQYNIASIVILSWSSTVFNQIVQETHATPTPYVTFQKTPATFTGFWGSKKITIVQAPLGAPALGIILEELIYLGATIFIGIGFAGSLNPDFPYGSIVLPNECISQEGTSKHYGFDASSAIMANPQLREVVTNASHELGLDIPQVSHWTTDAPYRETLATIQQFQKKGIMSVDMETSAMYAIASVRSVQCCNLLVISDELWKKWNPMFHSTPVKNALKEVKRLVLQVVEKLS